MNKQLLLPTLFLGFILSFNGFGQIGGNSTYSFLNTTSSPRIAAMGGDFLTIRDNDITLAPNNPSLINPGLDSYLGASFVDFYADITYGTAAFSKTFENTGSFLGFVQYGNYGTFDETDETGEQYGTFKASEMAVGIGWGRELDSLFSIGSNVKFIYSGFESYTSYGLAVDVAGSYTSPDRSFVASLIAANVGRQLKTYEGTDIQPIPFELQIGLSKRLKHLPFRYSVLINHLEKWDLRYENETTGSIDPITGEKIEDSGIERFADNFMRHIVLGGELLIGKSLSIRAGYNYKRRKELKIDEKTSTVGFSWGIGFRISKFHFNYARSTWHLAGSPNYISVTTRLSDFFRNSN